MSDDPKYLGHHGERLEWIEKALASTQKWIAGARKSASAERMFSRPGDFDYDVAIDLTKAIEAAEQTLKTLEAERKHAEASNALRKSDLEAGKYGDD